MSGYSEQRLRFLYLKSSYVRKHANSGHLSIQKQRCLNSAMAASSAFKIAEISSQILGMAKQGVYP